MDYLYNLVKKLRSLRKKFICLQKPSAYKNINSSQFG